MNPGAGQQQQPSDPADRRDDALGIVAIDDDEPVVLLDGVEVTDPWAPGAWDPRPRPPPEVSSAHEPAGLSELPRRRCTRSG